MRIRLPRSKGKGKASTESPLAGGRPRTALGVVLALAGVAVVAGPVSVGLAAGSGSGPVVRAAAHIRSAGAGSGAATLTGSVDPNGRPTTAHFEYGIDPKYRPPNDSNGLFNHSTPDQQVGAGFQYVSVSASVSGLVPNAVYHMRLVATNNGGTALGPDETFKTGEDPAPSAPTLGKTENVIPSGSVFYFAGRQQLPLTEPLQLPTGTVINALQGSVKLVAATGTKGGHSAGTFKGGVFRFSQARSGSNKGLTTVSLLEGVFSGGPSYALCKAKGTHTASKRILQTLHAQTSGRFRTTGHRAVGTVQGAKWSVAERCDGTVISVQLHSVLVQDLFKRITVVLRAGQSYLAKGP